MKTHCLEIRGEFACFTLPEMNVERVSYDLITPSAARAVFEAILWKPAMRWRVRRIEVLAPVRWINLRRNEVASVVSTRNVESAMRAGSNEGGRRAAPTDQLVRNNSHPVERSRVWRRAGGGDSARSRFKA